MTDSGPKLLFITPVMPAFSGNGLSMRAALNVEVLAESFDTYVLVIPVVASIYSRPPKDLSARCIGVEVLSLEGCEDRRFSQISSMADPMKRVAAYALYPSPALCRFATKDSIERARALLAGVRFDAVHVFRLYLAPFAEPYLEMPKALRPLLTLDMDDYESQTHYRLALAYDHNGDSVHAALERAEAQKYQHMESRYLRLFDRVFMASERDRSSLVQHHGCENVRLIPNGIRLPKPFELLPKRDSFTMLFVGTLGYYPNEDAALYLCWDVLPRLRTRLSPRLNVVIAGRNPSPRLRETAERTGVRVLPNVEDLAPIYRDADLVAVPIRIGGGTRIKLLEAFAYKRPVVSSSLGAEGLEVRHQEHLLIANDPAGFAAQCKLLMENFDLRTALAERALDFARTFHSTEAIRERIIKEFQ